MKNIIIFEENQVFIPVNCRVKGFNNFIKKYVSGILSVYVLDRLAETTVKTSNTHNGKSVRMNAETSETIRARILRCACLFQQGATPTLTPTNRPKLWFLQF